MKIKQYDVMFWVSTFEGGEWLPWDRYGSEVKAKAVIAELKTFGVQTKIEVVVI